MNIMKKIAIKIEESTNLFFEKIRVSRAKWVKECGDKKYIHIENNKIILNVGDKCEHIFTFDDIQHIGYIFRDDKNIFRVFMSKDSSTNKGDKTETYYYNIFIYQNMEYECKDVSTFLTELETNNITLYRVPDALQLSNNIKNKKTVICPTFNGWDIGDKQMELEEEEYARLHNTNQS